MDMKAFTDAIASGALPRVEVLNIARNNISNTGMASFSDAIGRGALAN